jgi:hypothetical protein
MSLNKYEISETNAIFRTMFVPVDPLVNYKMKIYLRRVSPPCKDDGSVMIGVGFQTSNSNWLLVSDRVAHFEYELSNRQVKSKWQLYEFTMGPSEQYKISNQAKFMTICVLINRKKGNAVYRVGGGEIVPILTKESPKVEEVISMKKTPARVHQKKEGDAEVKESA